MKNTVLKNKNKRILSGFLYSALFALTLILYSACPQNVALGGSVDILPPNGEITYPDAGETPIRGSFVLKGTAKDDEGVQAVSIVFENIETKDRTRSFQAELSAPGAYNTSWTASINNESTGTEPGHDLVKVYPIPDGEYTAIVTVTDNGGKTSKFTKNYKIDNTPPVFIVSRPSTTIDAADTTNQPADGYGAVFSVVGQAGERNTVEKLLIVADENIRIEKDYVGKNINIKAAADGDALYALQASRPANIIKAQISLYDNARKFTGSTPDTEGNGSDFFYLQDDIYDVVSGKGYTEEVISDYFAGKKGSVKNEHDQKILALRNDTDAKNALKNNRKMMNGSEAKRSTFKLDPNKSPGFRVANIRYLTKDSFNLGDISSAVFKENVDTFINIDLIPNKDGNPIIKGSSLSNYTASNIKINLYKWNGTGNESDSLKNFTEANLVKTELLSFEHLTAADLANQVVRKEGGIVKVKCKLPASFSEGNYLILVEGTDSSNESHTNSFVAYNDGNSAGDGLFVCKYLSGGGGARVRPVRDMDKYKKENFEIKADVTGLGTSGKVYYNIDSATVPHTPAHELSLDSGIRYKATVDINNPVSNPGHKLTDGDHKIYFVAVSSGGGTDSDDIDFIIDTTAPSVDISYPLPTDPQAGKITISGTITDGTGSGVKETGTKYILGRKASTPALDDPSWQNMTTSTKGSWNISDVNLDTMSAHPENYGTRVGSSSYYKVPLYIRSEDILGNATVDSTKEILFNPDGTKPVVRVLSPQADAVVGGTIQIFGTASAVTGGPSAVGEVYVQFSKTSDFTNASNMTFGTNGPGYTADWYQGGDGQVVPGTGSGPGQSGAEWRLEINGNGAFNGTSQRQDVYFRLRAKNKSNGRLGEWTTPIKIIVDKDAPLITDVKIENVSAPPSPQNYETNMWIGSGKKLTAKLTDPSGIKEVKITSSKMSGGISYTQTTAPSGWLTPYNAGGVSGYALSIPLNISGMSGNDFSIKVEITENTNTGLKSDSTFTFRFDTTPPTGVFGSSMYINSGVFGTSSVTNTALADKLRDLGANASSGAGAKILAENTELTVTDVSGSTVNFTPSIQAKEYNYILYKPEVLIYNEGSSSPWIVKGVANDDGSGVAKVEAWVTVDNGSTTHTIITETDNTNKITRQLGGQVTWKGQINLGSLKDGKGTLHYKITDKSGNEYNAPPVDVRVKNKPIKIKTITLVTDIGGSAVEFVNNDVNKALKDIDVDSNLDFTANYTSSAFAFKNENNSKIKVNFTGGEGQIKYSLKYNNAVLAGHYMQDISNNGIIILSQANLNTIGNTTGETTKELTLELWDNAHDCSPTGAVPLEKSSFAEVKINTLFDALDSTPPTVVILPFHWNGEGDNSLYENKRANGHVEIAKINSLGNDHSSVSGKVTLRGFAYDNIKIDSITAEVSGKTLTAALSGSGSTWTAGTITSADGIVLTVKKLGADYLGYYVTWQIDWDTEKIGVGLAKDIKVTANDGTTTFSDTGVTTAKTTGVTRSEKRSAEDAVFADKKPGQFVVFTKGETQYLTRIRTVTGNKATLEDDVPIEATTVSMYAYTANEPKTTVNVVPYITEIVTGLEGADSSNKGSFSRASTGEYPVRAGETIKVKGFNLAGGTIMLGTSSLGTNLNSVAIASSHTSGDLSVKVGSIESVNNKVDIIKPYNIEGNGINNDILNAKRKLFVWKMEPIINNNAMESPQFVMDKDSRFYMSLGSLGGAAPMKFFMLKNQRLLNGISDMNNDTYAYETTHSKFHNTVVAYDEAGNIYGGSTNTDKGGGDTTSFNFVAKQKPSQRNNYVNGSGKRRLEGSLNQGRSGGEIYDVNRIQIPKVAIRGKGLDTDKARIALAYYDRNNDNPPVKFRYGIVGTDSWTSMDKGLGYDLPTNGDYSANGYEIIADSNSSTYRSGLYVGVGLVELNTTTDRAVVAWYDSNSSALVYSYKDFDSTYIAPTGTDKKTTAWQSNAVRIDGAAPLFIDLVVDDDNGVHIGYYSSGEGGVKYTYLPPDKVTGTTKPASTDFKVVKVDTYMNPGTLLKIGVRKEGTKQVPYISYYHNGFYGSANAARIAWLKDGIGSDGVVKNGVESGKFTGNWVVMTVPASNGIQQYTICQGAPINGTYANKVIAAYFTTKNYEMAVLTK
ncbi:hypothetical protein H9I35_09100 [Treponema sp. Marseille-Q4132]|nr:hypothetical protein H9I35_09100 [Treponema sp. Marseille-Q4132]